MHELLSCGLLHSDIPGSKCACHSPRLFAAYRVLLRLLMPRHPPCALISLNSLFAELCLVLKIILKNFFLGEVEIVFTQILYWIFYNFLFVVSLFNFQRTLFHPPTFEVLGRHLLVCWNGLEPSTSRLSAECSNQLSYQPSFWWRLRESNPWPPACKAGALPAELNPRFGGHKWTRTIELTLIRRAL